MVIFLHQTPTGHIKISQPMRSAFKFAATGMRKAHPLHRPAQNPLHKNISVLNSTGHAFIPRTKSLVAFSSRIQTRSNSQLAEPSDRTWLYSLFMNHLTPLRMYFLVLGGLMYYGLDVEADRFYGLTEARDHKLETKKTDDGDE
jgi:hypothetical protein